LILGTLENNTRYNLSVCGALLACVTRVYRYVTLAVWVMYMADFDVIFVATYSDCSRDADDRFFLLHIWDYTAVFSTFLFGILVGGVGL